MGLLIDFDGIWKIYIYIELLERRLVVEYCLEDDSINSYRLLPKHL